MTCTLAASLLLAASFVCPPGDELPDPDGKPADTGKPVKVFVLLGPGRRHGLEDLAQARGRHVSAREERELNVAPSAKEIGRAHV